MFTFKEGDIVKCVDKGESWNHLTVGRVYKVIVTARNKTYVIDDRGITDWYFDKRFKLV